MKKELFPIVGMHCTGNKNSVERDLKKAVVPTGTYTLIDRNNDAMLRRTVVWVGIASIPFGLLMILELLFLFGLASGFEVAELFGHTEIIQGVMLNWLSLILFTLATPIIFVGGKQFYESAWIGLKAKSTNTDTLIALGTFTAWAYSATVTFFPNLFDSSGQIPPLY